MRAIRVWICVLIVFNLLLLACGGSYSAASGTISSPHYPNSYGFNEDCRYKIQVSSGNRVKLDFNSFNTESGFDFVTVRSIECQRFKCVSVGNFKIPLNYLCLRRFCCEIRLFYTLIGIQVHDGATAASPVLLRVSGMRSDLSVTTTGRDCLVLHTSDSKNSLTGWQAIYTSV